MVGVDVDLLVAACGHHGLVLRVHCLVAEAAEIARRDVVTSRALDRLGHGGDGLRSVRGQVIPERLFPSALTARERSKPMSCPNSSLGVRRREDSN